MVENKLKGEIKALHDDVIELIKTLRFKEVEDRLVVASKSQNESPIKSDALAYMALSFRKASLNPEHKKIKKQFKLDEKVDVEKMRYQECIKVVSEYFSWFGEHLIFENNTTRSMSICSNKNVNKNFIKIMDTCELPLSPECVEQIEELMEESTHYQYQGLQVSPSANWVIKSGFYLEYIHKLEQLKLVRKNLKQLKIIEKNIETIHSDEVYKPRYEPKMMYSSSNVTRYIREVSKEVYDGLLKID